MTTGPSGFRSLCFYVYLPRKRSARTSLLFYYWYSVCQSYSLLYPNTL